MRLSTEHIFLNAFIHISDIGPASIRVMKRAFGTYENAWLAPPHALDDIGLKPIAQEALIQNRPKLDPQRLGAELAALPIQIIAEDDSEYPAALREIPNPPAALYCRGTLFDVANAFDCSRTIAVVGTRRPTAYGKTVTEQLVSELASKGIAIASGLAVGIDTIAHKNALKVHGKIVAVVGSGISEHVLFPQENIRLAREIEEAGGAVVSEYPPYTVARPAYFPQRNRIISGLSRGTLVIEAREKSGALITARFALEQNRDVFAVPGSIFSLPSRGPNLLIKEGAVPVLSAEHIFEAWNLASGPDSTHSQNRNFSPQEKEVLDILTEPVDIGMIKQQTRMETHAIMTILSKFELEGIVTRLGPEEYQRLQ